MRIALPLARRWLALPPPICRTESSLEWVALSDGTRLATHVVRPAEPQLRTAPAVLLRTAHPLDAPSRLLAHLVAGRGYAAVVQSCRGRCDSEGRFTPFADEARDGAEALDWIAGQPWFDERLALFGFGYAGYAAWAACSRAKLQVNALIVGLAGRDPHRWLYSGGALQLELALRLGVGIGESTPPSRRRLDLARAARFRPLREADRVALRHTDWFRDWVDHPERDAFWDPLCPALPPKPPPALLIAGWYHPALGAQLRDHADLCEAAQKCGGAAPELMVGPWGAASLSRRERSRRGARITSALRAALEFLDVRLRDASHGGAPVRIYVRGADAWREFPQWPPPGAEETAYHLRSGGAANGLDGDGRLSEEPGPDEPPDRFVYDPADAVPSRGGAALEAPAGPVDQRDVECRGDVLCYTSDPLAADLVVAGCVRVVLFAASDAPDTDFTAKLVEVTEDGTASELCEGIVRCRRRGEREWLEPGRVERLEIDLWATSCRVRAGRSLRVEISSSSFPRFDRNSNTRSEPAAVTDADIAAATQQVYHDRERPSRVVLEKLPV